MLDTAPVMLVALAIMLLLATGVFLRRRFPAAGTVLTRLVLGLMVVLYCIAYVFVYIWPR